MSFTSDITEQYLIKVYDDLQREQTRLMNELKTDTNNEDRQKEVDITRQITIINSVSLNVLKLKSLRAKINRDI